MAKALAEGLGGKIKQSLSRAIELAPKHADAHIALGTWHAEVIDKVGSLVGGLTYGAKKDAGADLLAKALKLNPDSAIARIEYANGLLLLYGKAKIAEAEKLYQAAAKIAPADAMERLDVEHGSGVDHHFVMASSRASSGDDMRGAAGTVGLVSDDRHARLAGRPLRFDRLEGDAAGAGAVAM